MKLIEISKAKPGEMPISKHTAYKWHSQGKYPRLILKVLNKVFFDAEEWEAMVSKTKISTSQY
ncbi:DNA-binding protein [bacterium]|nr:MAG: DNA-binding protein [bacterium]